MRSLSEKEMRDIAATKEYKEWEIESNRLNKNVEDASNAMNIFPVGRGQLGLIPDIIRKSSEYKAYKAVYSKAFHELQAFNKKFNYGHGNMNIKDSLNDKTKYYTYVRSRLKRLDVIKKNRVESSGVIPPGVL